MMVSARRKHASARRSSERRAPGAQAGVGEEASDQEEHGITGQNVVGGVFRSCRFNASRITPITVRQTPTSPAERPTMWTASSAWTCSLGEHSAVSSFRKRGENRVHQAGPLVSPHRVAAVSDDGAGQSRRLE
jgi:hypothetical protein